MQATTAILFFSRTAGVEAQHKQLFRSEARNQAALAGMIARTRQIVSNSGLPVFWLSERDQRGESFGERIFNAARSVVAQGYQQLIIVGNDSPQLRKSDLIKAGKMLAEGRSVLGLNKRGGAYLIGLQARQLSAAFQDLPWQTGRLAEQLRSLLWGAGHHEGLLLRQPKTVTLLRALHDFNGSEAKGLLAKVSRGFRSLACCICLSGCFHSIEYQLFDTRYIKYSFSRRGPPVVG